MIDPINSAYVSNRSGPYSSLNAVRQESKSVKENTGTDKKNSAAVNKLTDQVSISMDVRGELQILSQSVSTVFQDIKTQLEDYYGLSRSQGESDSESIESEYLPSEDASASELLDYYSPENTAERIVNFTTGFFDAYLQNHEDESMEENINGFTTLMQDAIQKGFDEAEDQLGEFDGLGKVGENIMKTYDMVMQNLEEYRLTHLNDLGLETESAEIDATVMQAEGENLTDATE